ncbi:MAG: RNA polymerase sigma factor [Actinomycetota bacterium]|jgi:RNA polymerase sigma-70 factor (ECF subfamily)|nr:RNA polymerase sigma factor [Actinomycetota bacterium]
MDETDEQLLGWSKAGDKAAFVEIFWRHGSAVHAYLSRRTGRQDADDLLSEVWLRAFRGRTSYDCRYPDARPWLYGIARNVLRAHWREADRPLAFTEEAAATDPWSDADRRLDAAAQVEMLRPTLATLSADEREVLLLVVWEQLSPAEVAVALGIPQGTARSRLHRALSALRCEVGADSSFLNRLYPKEA